MSSSTGLARTRSLRKPAAGAESTQPDASTSQQRPPPEPRNTSPSRLPVKPGAGRPASNSVSAAAGTKARPVAGISRTTSVRRPQQQQQGGAGQDKQQDRADAVLSKPTTTTTSYPPLTRRQVSQASSASTSSATSRPTTSAGLPSSSRPRAAAGHARTKSSATTLTGATVLRPPSQASSATSTSTSTRPQPPTAAKPPPPAPVGGGSGGGGSGALHRRQPSQPAAARPAFTTHQQHFSPLKTLAPKPLTSTFLAPPSPSKQPANVALTAETARLQTHLLQLHLAHRAAEPTAASWRASARRALGERFARLAAADEALRRDEALVDERLAVAALRSWGGGEKLADRIQALDGVVSGVWALGEPGGRYARVVKAFERWADRAARVDEVRARGLAEDDDDDELLFIEEMDQAWRDDCAALSRKLDGFAVMLDHLGGGGGGGEDDGDASSLARMLRGCRCLVRDMLAEITAMEQIEREALRREAEWIQRMNRDDGDGDIPRAGAIWRVV